MLAGVQGDGGADVLSHRSREGEGGGGDGLPPRAGPRQDAGTSYVTRDAEMVYRLEL